MKIRHAVLIFAVLATRMPCLAQQAGTTGTVCDVPKLAAPGPGYESVQQQPDKTADLPSVVQTVEQALKCYQALTHETDPTQPKGLPKLSSVVMDFKTTTGTTGGLTFSIFIFKIGGSREKDITDEIKFTYSVPKETALPTTQGLVKVGPAPLFQDLVNDVEAAASAAQSQSSLLNIPLSNVSITISYGIKFDANVSLNAPVQLVTIGGSGDYNRNNTQTITLTFGK
jgi:hypothetical protein